MRNGILALLACVTVAFAWTDITVPNTFVDSGIIYASDHNENDSTLAAGINTLQDSVEQYFIRFTDLTSGDTTLSKLKVDSIRSNPDMDSIQGRPWIDSINTAYVQVPTIKTLDTLRGNPDVDSIRGYPWIDSVNTSMINVTRIYTDSIKGATYADTLTGMNQIRGNPDMDSAQIQVITGMNTMRGNPSADSITVSTILNVTGKITTDSITGLDVIQGNPNVDSLSGTTYHSGKIIIDSITGLDVISGNPDIDSIGRGGATSVVLVDSLNALLGIQCQVLLTSFVNTGNGLVSVHPMNQPIRTTDTVTFDSVIVTKGVNAATVNTGNGNNELYAMDQNVRTTDNVVFKTGEIGEIGVGWDSLTLSSNAVNLNTYATIIILDTEGAAALDTIATINQATGVTSPYGRIVILKTTDSGRDIYVDGGAGNIGITTDITLASKYDSIMLIYMDDGSWHCINYYNL